jgi:uncharacterized protein (TIGR02301 family)
LTVRRPRRLSIALTALMLFAWPAVAQVPAPPPTPPYDDPLRRLSEILGSVHNLRQVCGTNEGSVWRDQMQALLDSEQPDPTRRARMIDRFNRGYESYQSVYRTCTDAARVAIDRYLAEGAKIAGDVATRYGK